MSKKGLLAGVILSLTLVLSGCSSSVGIQKTDGPKTIQFIEEKLDIKKDKVNMLFEKERATVEEGVMYAKGFYANESGSSFFVKEGDFGWNYSSDGVANKSQMGEEAGDVIILEELDKDLSKDEKNKKYYTDMIKSTQKEFVDMVASIYELGFEKSESFKEGDISGVSFNDGKIEVAGEIRNIGIIELSYNKKENQFTIILDNSQINPEIEVEEYNIFTEQYIISKWAE